MKIDEALSILDLTELNRTYSRKEIKFAYRKLINLYHPDKDTGNVEMSKLVNEAWKQLKDLDEATFLNSETSVNLSQLLQDAIDSVRNLDGVIIEIIGCWIWVSGNTKPHKEILKDNKFRYSRGKGWYFTTAQKKRLRSYCSTLQDIRDNHGSETIKSSRLKQIAA
jgi:hypothetical protein